jgi:hypothetical protein
LTSPHIKTFMNVMTAMSHPNGRCWCDCGEPAQPGSFFLQGHDKRAERYLDALDGGTSLAQRLAERGYVPGSGKSLRDDTLASDNSYEECGRLDVYGNECRIIGRGAGMRRHRATDDRHAPRRRGEGLANVPACE